MRMKTGLKMTRWRNLLLMLITLCLVGTAALFNVSSYVKWTVKDKIITPEEATGFQADCILVLGAGLQADGSPSPMLRDRLETGVSLFESGVSDRLLMSGDHGTASYDEVNAMKKFAIEAGVPSECIFMDHAGFSTYESLYRARDVFQADKLIIVTQEYHLYRALYVAGKLGLDVRGVAADGQEYDGQELRELREVLARVKDFFVAIVLPEPTYLGDPIPVSGNGDVTNDSAA